MGNYSCVGRILFALICCQTLFSLVYCSSDVCSIRFGRRGCYHRILTGVLVTCDGLGTETEVPQIIPADTVYLSLTNFNLGTLRKEDFMYGNIECLTITDSDIDSVEPDAFSAMENLGELVLSVTELTKDDLAFMSHPTFTADLLTVSESPNIRNFSVDATTTLHQLKTLQFAGNNLNTISPRLFPELRRVERLDLSRNNLRSLDWEGLHEMTKLNQLLLASNLIQTLPEYLHDIFFAVKELKLGNNPFHCNCQLAWLRNFFLVATDKQLDLDLVSCASPEVIPISQADESHFRCSQPSSPVIEWKRLPDNRYEVNCSAEGDPAPTLNLVLPEGRQIISPPSADLSMLKTITPQIICGGGHIYCKASNSVGESDTSQELPTDDQLLNDASSQMPSSLYILLMTTIAIVCHVSICFMGS